MGEGLLMKAFSGGGIKSVQRGVSTVPDVATNITINTVDRTKCLVLVTKFGTDASQLDYDDFINNVWGVVTTSTNLALVTKRVDAYISVSWTLIEFAYGTVQHGTITPTAVGVNNTTISAVDMDKAILVHTETVSNFTTGIGDEMRDRAKVELTSSTNIAVTLVVYNSVHRVQYMIWSP